MAGKKCATKDKKAPVAKVAAPKAKADKKPAKKGK